MGKHQSNFYRKPFTNMMQRLFLVLEALANNPDPEGFPETVRSEAYTDPRVARQIARLHPRLAGGKVAEPPAKRLRASGRPQSLSELLEILDGLVPGRLFSVEPAYDEGKLL
jgi:hypothetical protein